MKYALYETLIDPARPTSGLGRLIVGTVIFVVGYVVMTMIYFATIGNLADPSDWPNLREEINSGTSVRGMLLLLSSFAIMITAVAISLHLVHFRSLMTLFGPWRQVVWDFTRISGAIFLLYILLSFLPIPDKYRPTPNLAPDVWRSILPIAALGILVQVTAEELVFRGYLQSQLAARFRSPLIWIGAPTIIFALLHYDPASTGENTGVILLTIGLFGLAAADLTARSGSLGAAIALHFTTNTSALLFAASKSGLNGLALSIYPFELSDISAVSFWLPIDLMVILITWLLARIIIRR